MYPAPFEYVAASSVEEAVGLLQKNEDAKILAGGHSLLPMMKLRLATPSLLVDIGRIQGLSGVQVNGNITIGPLATYASLIDSEALAKACPLIGEAAAEVGDMQVRNRGTIGGSAAHADPASDMPAVLLALNATFTAQGANGTRTIPASDFFQGLMTTALDEHEILTGISIPALPAGTGTAYAKFKNPASGYAIVGVAAVVTLSGGSVSDVRVGLTGAGSSAVRASAVENALRGTSGDEAAISAAASHAAEGVDLIGDIHASPEYRAHLATVFTRRALNKAIERARG
jgi:carbon-monoxide dehydrogenase medium subunit